MKKAIILVIVICLLTGCNSKKKEVLKINEESNLLTCTALVNETDDNIERITHKIILEFTKDNLEYIDSTMYMYIDLKDSSKLDESFYERICNEDNYKSCETSIDNNRLTIKISGDLKQILGTDSYKNYLEIKDYLIDNNYKCVEEQL